MAVSGVFGAELQLRGPIPIAKRLREGDGNGRPLVLDAPDSAAGKELLAIVDKLTGKPRGLAGLSLGLSPATK